VAYVGDCDDIRRTPSGLPESDRSLAPTGHDSGAGSGDPRTTGFGGPHPSGANIAYCDGSVRFVRDDEQLQP
jgi:prepilin-type processing-associated H-X9-DG protein